MKVTRHQTSHTPRVAGRCAEYSHAGYDARVFPRGGLEQRLHNDEPTLWDRLRREALIKEVGEAVATCEPPQVFGVHGDWGLGKTSFLHQVRYHLTGENPQLLEVQEAPPSADSGRHLQTVWFDAWRYHAEAVPVVALLQEMRAQMSDKALRRSKVKRLGKVAVHGTLLGLDDLAKKIVQVEQGALGLLSSAVQYTKFQQASRQWDAENLAATLPSDTLRQHLQETIGLLLPATTKAAHARPRLVVFVDDLDRCEPDAAYRLLEGLKVYLTLNNCVFVLGLNQKAVEGAIASRLAAGQTDESAKQDAQVRAASYLEKICQNIWHLPIVQAPGQLLCDFIADDGVAAHQVGWLRAVVGRRQCLPPNPRKLKGLANLVIRFCSRLPEALKDSKGEQGRNEMRRVLIVAYAHQFHHDLYVRWQANPSLYHAIASWCRHETQDSVLKGLVLPIESGDHALADEGEESGDTAEPAGMGLSTFPDPTAANVFWVGNIVRDLPDEVDLDAFAPYLETST